MKYTIRNKVKTTDDIMDIINTFLLSDTEESANEAHVKLKSAIEELVAFQKPDMFWNSDDGETLYQSIGEFLNDELCNGRLEVGDVRTLRQAKRLPDITIRITSVDDDNCEADWEVIDEAIGETP